MTKLPGCPDCGMQPSITIRCRGINWGSAQVRCSNGCAGRSAGFSCPPGGEEAARADLIEKWKKLVEVAADGHKKIT